MSVFLCTVFIRGMEGLHDSLGESLEVGLDRHCSWLSPSCFLPSLSQDSSMSSCS